MTIADLSLKPGGFGCSEDAGQGAHPGCPYLVNYALGRLSSGQALAVATHLALCLRCKAQVANIEGAAGLLLETVAPKPVSSVCLKGLMQRLGSCDRAAAPPPRALTPDGDPLLPPVLERQAGCAGRRLAWRRLMPGIDQIRLKLGQGGERVRLVRLHSGTTMPQHCHSGEELTVILSGSLTDGTRHYERGDFVSAGADHHHQPRATGEEPCVTLSVTQGPMKPDGWYYRIWNFFLRF